MFADLKKISVLFDYKERRQLIMLFIGVLIMGLLEVAGVASIAPFMAIVIDSALIHENNILKAAYQFSGVTSSNHFLFGVGAVVLVVLSLSNAYTAFMNWWISYFVQMQGHRLSNRLLKQYLSQPYPFFLGRNTADLSKNVLSEVGRIVSGVMWPGMLALTNFVIVAFLFILLLAVDALLAVSVAIVLGGAYFMIYKVVRQWLHRIGEDSTEAVLQRYKIANEAMSGIKDLKLLRGEREFLRRFEKPSEVFAICTAQGNVISLLPRYALETVAFGGILTIVLYLIAVGKTSGQVIPLMALFALAGYRLMPALQQVYRGVTAVRYNFPALEVLADDLSSSDVGGIVPEQEGDAMSFENSVRLCDISFRYPGSEVYVIDALNLEIKKNTTVGLVGSSGSGKTTLVDILLGLLMSESGRILVDNNEVCVGDISRWQWNLGYVPQSIYLTDDTIERNIALAVSDLDIDAKRVAEAAKIAELDQFIESLPERYQTYVGERGVRISGGQRQRIGIARALYRNPKMLIMDEATSALDGITENIIMDTIHKLSHRMTIVMIAHRLATVRECDVIYVLANGKIVDSGSYDDLLERNDQFRRMAQI